ncbi:Alcohol acetyltransferase [Niveomyces insectorum RCEF 264]|uniref:Alcohol acetyltransferase n=1 Tax=Niveomyces insectorum RCEF 264 TaxID=1081102 RepID=A0A162I8Q9_9HYPO|nr:Alcohol acetyltransferase [Niveomyces insectorum RCEF 264]
MVASGTVIRPLGGYEQYSSSRHSLGLYESVITICRYALPTTPTLAEEQIRASIQAAVATVVRDKLPALRVGLLGEETKKPVYVAVPSLDLDDHVEWRMVAPGLSAAAYDAQLMRQLEDGTARAWPDVGTHPPWRLVVHLNRPEGWADLAFAFHHATGDGKSGQIFHTHLVETLNEQQHAATNATDAANATAQAQQPGTSVLTFTDVPALVPPQEELVRFTISWGYMIREVWSALGPSWFQSTPSPATAAYTGKRTCLEPKLKGHKRVFHISAQHAAALLAGCRANGTTLTALLHGLLLVSFARRFPAAVAPTFVCDTPISLRPFAQLPPASTMDINRSMANLVCDYAYTFDPAVVADGRAQSTNDDDDRKVWRAAAAFGASLKARLATITHNNIMGLLGWVSDWHQWWLDHGDQPRKATWVVSNVGSLSATGARVVAGTLPAAESPWRLTRNFYVQSSTGKDALISLNVASIQGGEMSFHTAWHDGVIDDHVGDELTADLQECLVRFGQTGRFDVPSRLSTC